MTRGCRPRRTRAARAPGDVAVPVPGTAGYQTRVSSTRVAPVATDVVVKRRDVTPTPKGPGFVGSDSAPAVGGASRMPTSTSAPAVVWDRRMDGTIREIRGATKARSTLLSV